MSNNLKNTSNANVDANIIGITFKATTEGKDPEYPNINGFVPDRLYIRMRNGDGTFNYIDAYEIDKAIGIIGGKTASKADQSTVDAIQDQLEDVANGDVIDSLEQRLEEKASSVDLQNLSNKINEKASKSSVDDINTTLSYKANSSDLTDLKKEINTKISSEIINVNTSLAEKASKSSIETLKADIEALKKASGSVADSNTIAAIENQIKLLEEELNNRLSVDSLEPVNDSIDELNDAIKLVNGKIYTLENAVDKKANVIYVQNQITELNNAITSLSNIVDGKVNKIDFNKKANKDDLDVLKDKLLKLTEKLNLSVKEFTKSIGDITSDVNNKADKKETESKLFELNSKIESKADYKSTNDAINQINKKLNSYSSNFDEFDEKYVSIHELSSAVNAVKDSLVSTDKAHDEKLSQHTTQIIDLQKRDSEIEKLASNEWIKIMSPEEYNRLNPNPNYSDGSKNPFGRQPNVIYLTMKYNKPQALYIGSIQIAKAETINGSTGFTYTFPIIF